MIVELQPGVYNDVTTLASATDTGLLSIEYLNGNYKKESVLLFLDSSEPTDNTGAVALLVCDQESIKSVRTIQGVAGSKVYAFFSGNGTGTEPIKVLVG